MALVSNHPERDVSPFEDALETDPEWVEAAGLLQRDYLGFLEFFFGRCFNEPHSSKQIEDCIGWALQTTPQTILDTILGIGIPREELFRQTCARVRCPTLVIHGDRDLIRPHVQGEALARATGGDLVTLHGSGHIPLARDPVRVNVLIREFVDRRRPSSAWTRAKARGRRALYISSPIGLGHAQRDVAIADELRNLHPDLQIDWLAQHPVTEVLEAEASGSTPRAPTWRTNPATSSPSPPSTTCTASRRGGGWTRSCVANFMVFHDLVADEQLRPVDRRRGMGARLLPAREPRAQARRILWLTDFVGWLPMADGGEHEAFLTADYNAEMIEQIARYPRVRDRAVFVGDPDDIVAENFGAGLPPIRDWTEQHFSFAGYITGFDPVSSPTARRCEPSSATATTSRCASSPSAAQASARIFSGA